MITPTINNAAPEDTTNFWIVCCEESAVAQQLSKTIADWEIPGVRSLVGTHELVQSEVKQADYAIFATKGDRPCAQVQVSPLSHSQSPHIAQLLSSLQGRYGRQPQSWLLQLPTEEMRANRLQPVDTQDAVGQALSKIEVFVRNYHLQPQIRKATLQEVA
ncbi:MAG: hypothetical protein WA947_22285 [Phormidesmis sp.]